MNPAIQVPNPLHAMDRRIKTLNPRLSVQLGKTLKSLDNFVNVTILL